MNDERKDRAFSDALCEWMDAVVNAVLLCVFLFTFVFKTFSVVGSSMQPTYYAQDRVFAVVPWFGLETGDVVVTDAHNGTGDPLIKRVVATEYQLVELDYESGALYVEGILFDSPIATSLANLAGDRSYPFYVPAGMVFVMGDNRAASYDSRFTAVGFIDVRSVIGKVFE